METTLCQSGSYSVYSLVENWFQLYSSLVLEFVFMVRLNCWLFLSVEAVFQWTFKFVFVVLTCLEFASLSDFLQKGNGSNLPSLKYTQARGIDASRRFIYRHVSVEDHFCIGSDTLLVEQAGSCHCCGTTVCVRGFSGTHSFTGVWGINKHFCVWSGWSRKETLRCT